MGKGSYKRIRLEKLMFKFDGMGIMFYNIHIFEVFELNFFKYVIECDKGWEKWQ